jgi:predicted Zn-ribbon and HTH transcriptional regulator
MGSACHNQAVGQQLKRRPKWELADIFRQYGEAYRSNHALPLSHLKVMHSIEVCRTDRLGGHILQCDQCGYQRQAYNSCRNRHCPKCQVVAGAQWLEDRKAELLPVPYFHLVFTLPHELNAVALSNKKVVCDILFKSVSETLLEFGRRHLGGKLGFIAVLHTWDQTLRDHFHLHCLIAGGALARDDNCWIAARKNFLFAVRALSVVFRGKFLDLLEQAFAQGTLKFVGRTSHLAEADSFRGLIKSVLKKKWVVYAKKPFCSPEKVLDYLGRYTRRVAITNNRILRVGDGTVSFSYRDRRNSEGVKTMTLESGEFIRRFLLHVLPEGLQRIRQYGFLANRTKKKSLARWRELLSYEPVQREKKTTREMMLEVSGEDVLQCPSCKQGAMVVMAVLPNRLTRMDSS